MTSLYNTRPLLRDKLHTDTINSPKDVAMDKESGFYHRAIKSWGVFCYVICLLLLPISLPILLFSKIRSLLKKK